MPETNLPATGSMGVKPPADAPMQTSEPIKAEAVAQWQQLARQNERTLAPLEYGKLSTPPANTSLGGVQEATGEVQAPQAVQAAPGYAQAPVRGDYPAASNSDSPTRGMPGTAPIPAERSTVPIGITGGFGAAEADYFPLDGRELLKLSEHLIGELRSRIQNDLRFSIAVTYPRLNCRVQLIVEGEVEDQGFTIEHKLPPQGVWNRTPVDVAKDFGDSMVFVVTALRREFAGNIGSQNENDVETPADAIRDELGLRKPRKQFVGDGQNRSLVDVVW